LSTDYSLVDQLVYLTAAIMDAETRSRFAEIVVKVKRHEGQSAFSA
jgi:hypothetical protein